MTSAIEQWTQTVVEEHLQADRVRTDDPQQDHWKGLAHRFVPASRDDAYGDETLKALMEIVRPGDTVLDVGAGGGRLSVPLAEHCREVTAVEPSPAMRERLAEQASAWGVTNVSIVPARWEEADVAPADIVICAHVVYTVQDIAPFLRKLTDHARREVCVIIFEEPAVSNYFDLWPLVHGEDRISLPCLPELKRVLSELDIRFTAEALPSWQSRPFKDVDAAVSESQTRLFVGPGTGKAARLEAVVRSSLVHFEDGLRFRWNRPHRPWMVRWQP